MKEATTIIGRSGTILAPNGRPAYLEAMENNWYEGSRWSPNRSWVWFPVQDAKQDLDRFTRYELMKRARYLYKNSPFIRGLIERIVVLTIGSGFHPVFKSAKKPDWARKAQLKWGIRSANINLGHKCSFSQYQRAMGRARFLDGEAFTIKTFDEVSYEDRVQGVEADRVTSEGSTSEQDKKNISTIDGIRLNNQGTPTAYKFRGVEKPYDADNIIHHYTPNRFGQYRGETILAAAINTATDVDDILALEKQAVKNASSIKDVIKTASGQIDQETFRSLRWNTGLPTPFGLPADDNNAKNDYYRVKLGPESVVLKTGDEYTPVAPIRPGAAWQGFMDFLSGTVCLSTQFPPSVILPVDIGGTDIRRDLEIAQRVVEPWQLDMAAELELVVRYLMMGDIHDGDLKDAPDDWIIKWHFPQKLNVDRQTAQQDREDVQAGLMSHEEFHGRYSDDGDAYELTVIAETRRRRFNIIGTPIDQPFKDAKEFVQFLSLDTKMFQASDPAAKEKEKSNATA